MGNVILLDPDEIPHFTRRRLNQVAITTEGNVTCPRFMNLRSALYQCNHAGTDFCTTTCPHHATLGLTRVEAEAMKGIPMNGSDARSTIQILDDKGEWKDHHKALDPNSLADEYYKKLKEIQRKRKGGVRLMSGSGEILKQHKFVDGHLQNVTQPMLF